MDPQDTSDVASHVGEFQVRDATGFVYTYASQCEHQRAERLAKARQHLAHRGTHVEDWHELTEDERITSTVAARHYLRAAIAAGLIGDCPDHEPFVVVPETYEEAVNCAEFASTRRAAADLQVSEAEFVDLWGRGVKVQPAKTGNVPAVLLLYGTDARLLEHVARDHGISQDDVETVVRLLSSSARLCPEMAGEVIRALQEFVDEHPPCPTTT